MPALALEDFTTGLDAAWAAAARGGSLRVELAGGLCLSVVASSGADAFGFALRERGGALRRLPLAERVVGRFAIQHNPARALRPQPGTAGCAFACSDAGDPLSILPRTPRLSVAELGLALIPQGFPIDPRGHWLVLPGDAEGLPHRPQRLTATAVEGLLRLASAAPAALLFFNSLGAGGGTVDHLHAHLMPHAAALPIECLGASSGALAPFDGWPAGVVRVAAPALPAAVERLEAAGIPFNLLLRGGVAHLAARIARVAPSSGLTVAALEVGGRVVVSDREPTVLADDTLATALRETVLPASVLAALLVDARGGADLPRS